MLITSIIRQLRFFRSRKEKKYIYIHISTRKDQRDCLNSSTVNSRCESLITCHYSLLQLFMTLVILCNVIRTTNSTVYLFRRSRYFPRLLCSGWLYNMCRKCSLQFLQKINVINKNLQPFKR